MANFYRFIEINQKSFRNNKFARSLKINTFQSLILFGMLMNKICNAPYLWHIITTHLYSTT